MRNCETGCFASCAREADIIVGLEDLNVEVIQLATTIKNNFEELGK
ncbi:hypothetical protein [Nitrosomonas communis]|nr:hypothetical protein [Nitrosomonas communis]MCO6427913.1 hypothetical protein [Nitrosomonas communis]